MRKLLNWRTQDLVARFGEVETKIEKQTYKFNQEEIDEIVQARYEEIFEAIAKELKRAGRLGSYRAALCWLAARRKSRVWWSSRKIN